MDKLERSKVILDVLNRQEKATIKELSSLLKVSGVTVRKDLEALEQRRLVIRTQGNVRLFTDSLLIGERDYADKASRSIAEKKRIAKAAAALIEDGDTLFYDIEKNQFLVLAKDGYIRTFFRPDDGIGYWNRQ